MKYTQMIIYIYIYASHKHKVYHHWWNIFLRVKSIKKFIYLKIHFPDGNRSSYITEFCSHDT